MRLRGKSVCCSTGVDLWRVRSEERKAEYGAVDLKYGKLIELDTNNYSVRTERNIKAADATLIF